MKYNSNYTVPNCWVLIIINIERYNPDPDTDYLPLQARMRAHLPVVSLFKAYSIVLWCNYTARFHFAHLFTCTQIWSSLSSKRLLHSKDRDLMDIGQDDSS